VIGPFLKHLGIVSLHFQGFLGRFERATEAVAAASENPTLTHIQATKTIRLGREKERLREEEWRAECRQRLHQRLTAAIYAMSPTNEPTEAWARRLTARLAEVGQEITAQQWEDWARGMAEGEHLTQGLVELLLKGDESRIEAVVRELRDTPSDLHHMADWLKSLKHDWSCVFDQGWLWWKLTSDLPVPEPQPADPQQLDVEEPQGSDGKETPDVRGSAERQPHLPDGPFDTDGFRYQTVEVRFGRAVKQRSLVLALWDQVNQRPREARPLENILDEVYGEGHDTEDATFRQLCVDTRSRFEKAAMPLTITTMQGQVQLTPRPP
jgi:hypothetical protein